MGRMDGIIAALAKANVWQLAGAVLVVVAGSSAVSAWITGSFESRRASKSFKREVRAAALDAASTAYSAYVRFGSAMNPVLYDEARDKKLAAVSAVVQAKVAAIGSTGLLELAVTLVEVGELFAGQNEDTSVQVVHDAFAELVFEISRSIPEK